MKCITFDKEAQNNLPQHIKDKMKEDKKQTNGWTRLTMLSTLLAYSDRYEITVQFWPEQTAVFIAKGGIELADFGGDYDFAMSRSIQYLNRLNNV